MNKSHVGDDDHRAMVFGYLKEGIAALALPPAEQIRITLPGCVTCDLLNDFDSWSRSTLNEFGDAVTSNQKEILEAISRKMDEMTDEDYECAHTREDALPRLTRPRWDDLRKLAEEALHIFGWPKPIVEPYCEVSDGIWHRPRWGDLGTDSHGEPKENTEGS